MYIALGKSLDLLSNYQFLVDNDILFKHQFGFRPGHSTSHALINFVNKVANAVDHQKY